MSVSSNGVHEHPARTICGIATELFSIMIPDLYDPMAIPTAWQKFWSGFPKSDLPNGSSAFGVVTPINEPPGKLRYLAGVEVNSDYVAPAGFEVIEVPAGKYLELAHEGKIATLGESYGEAYGVTFPQTGLEMREAAHIELYDSSLNPNADDYRMGIFIPVK